MSFDNKTRVLTRKTSPRERIPPISVNNIPGKSPFSDLDIDMTLLDYKPVEDFLRYYRTKSDQSNLITNLAKQLKASRALFMLDRIVISNSHDCILKIIDSSISIIGAEDILLLKLDDNNDLFVYQSKDGSSNKVTLAKEKGVEGECALKRKSVLVPDVKVEVKCDLEFYSKLKIRVKSVMCCPILFEDKVLGVLAALNKNAGEKSFSNFDLSCLEHAAANIAKILKPSSRIDQQASVRVRIPDEFSRPEQNEIDLEAAVEAIVDEAYACLQVERISVFICKESTNDLICIASPDIKGLTLPADSGLIGYTFRNVAKLCTTNAKADKRHNPLIDEQTGFLTTSLLSYPIVGVDGVPIGVLQAVNKKNGEVFSTADESTMCTVSQKVAALFSYLREQTLQNRTKEVLTLFSEYLNKVSIHESQGFFNIIEETEHVLKSITNCESVYFFHLSSGTVDKNSESLKLFLVNSNHQLENPISLNTVAGVVAEALKTGNTLEFKKDSSTPKLNIVPGLNCSQAVIIPLTSKLNGCVHEYNYSIDLMIVAKNSTNAGPFTSLEKAALNTAVSALANSLKGFCVFNNYRKKSIQSDSRAMAMSAIVLKHRCFSFVLSSEGKVVVSSPEFETFFGFTNEDIDVHFVTFLCQYSPQLAKDLGDSLKSGRQFEKFGILLTSSAYPNGLKCDYTITADNRNWLEKFDADSDHLQAVSTSLSPYYLVVIQVNEDSTVFKHLESSNNNSFHPRLHMSPINESISKSELENLFTWEFNVLRIKSREVMYLAVFKCIERLVDFNDIGIKKLQFQDYLIAVDESYRLNPFHNFYHAVCVTHFIHMLLYETGAKDVLTSVNLFAVIFSAIVHDVDHPGNTNAYEVNKGTRLAILYNDNSVLENHHCATAFQLMERPGLNLMEGFDTRRRVDFRKLISSCILATDMAIHGLLVDELNQRVKCETPWDLDNPQEKILYCKILVHSADLSNPVRPFFMAKEWASRVSEEFNAQCEKERQEGLPVSTFLQVVDVKALAKSEVFFNSQVVAPLWRGMAMLFPSTKHLVEQIDRNLESWKELSDDLS